MTHMATDDRAASRDPGWVTREQVDGFDWYHTFDLPGGIERGGPLFQPFCARMPRWPEKLPRTSGEAVFWLCTRRFGGATAWALARPAR
ncbi:hypothetical protein BH20ACT2_BH20ACT2_20650 [soil metagenome]